jgi:hypothetical protein
VKPEDIPPGARERCRSCKAHIIWTVTDAGKDMPVDLEPGGYDTADKNGKARYVSANLALIVVGDVIKSRVVRPELAFGNTNLHLAHWVRCPHSKMWRRGSGTPRRAGKR